MGNWVGVVTNAGNTLLSNWLSGTTLTVVSAQAGTGTADSTVLLVQTALANAKQTISITSYQIVDGGMKLRMQITAPETGYTLQQIGVFAQLDGGSEALLALFQNESGITIPSAASSSDFAYTFYGFIAIDNTGLLSVTIDSSVFVTADALATETAAREEADIDLQSNIDLKGNALTATKNIWVATTGSDDTGDGSSENPYATISRAVAVAPKNLNGYDYNIYIAAGTYTDSFACRGFHGGSIMLRGCGDGGVVLNGSFEISSGTSLWLTSNLSLTVNPTAVVVAVVYAVWYSNFFVDGGASLTINGTYNGTKCNAIVFETCSRGVAWGTVTVNNAGAAILATNASIVRIATLAGAGNDTDLYSYGAFLTYSSLSTTGTVNSKLLKQAGGVLCSDNESTPSVIEGIYTGTGLYGADSPNSLILITPDTGVNTPSAGSAIGICVSGIMASVINPGTGAWVWDIDGTTISWYSSVGAAQQSNTAGVTYRYRAVL